MKVALRGTVPSPLPGLSGGEWSFPPPLPNPEAPRQVAAPPNNGVGGLDSWLLDKLFGQH